MNTKFNYFICNILLPKIEILNSTPKSHGGIYLCTGIYFFKSAIFYYITGCNIKLYKRRKPWENKRQKKRFFYWKGVVQGKDCGNDKSNQWHMDIKNHTRFYGGNDKREELTICKIVINNMPIPSLPARGAWVEINMSFRLYEILLVAPRKGERGLKYQKPLQSNLAIIKYKFNLLKTLFSSEICSHK